MEIVEIAGVGIVALIIGLVEMAKRLGLSARAAAPLAVGLGLAIALLYQLAQQHQELQGWLQAALIGIMLGLSAAGLYSGGKATLGR